MRLELVTAPATDPVTLAEVKTRLRIDGSTDDAGVSRLITAATAYAQNICRRAFVTQKWALILDAFPCNSNLYPYNSIPYPYNSIPYPNSTTCPRNSIALPLPPLQSVDLISYVDTAGATQTLPNTDYLVDKSGLIGLVHLAYGKSWPTTRAQPMAVRVEFTAGYGAAAAVPSDLVSALMLLIAHWDQNREPVVVGVINSALPMSVDSLLAPYVIPGVA